jgi:DNA helicase IV
LERKVVLVLGFDASYFMFGREKESQEQCPPSMYVALTRAVQGLTVFHNKNKDYFPFVK